MSDLPHPEESLVLISLGSNLGDRQRHLNIGLQEIASLRCHMDRRSSFYETEPWGMHDQPKFVNGACGIYTSMEPKKLLEQLQEIERKCRRERVEKWGPRTLDIDIISYGDIEMSTPILRLPHPHFRQRPFVLEPLAEIYPDHIISGKTVAEHLKLLQLQASKTHNQ